MFNKLYTNIFWVAAVLLLVSCKKFTEIDPPKNAIGTEQVFADDVSATSAVLGIYSTLNTVGFGYGNLSLYPGISSDELIRMDPDQSARELMDNSLRASNENTATLWTEAYKVIGQANACIEGLNTENGVSAAKKKELLAESRFLRAFSYFYLVNLYGKVPLIVTTDWTQTKHISRSSTAEINQLIMEDLNAAYAGLPASHTSGTLARANKWTAAAMLAREHLYLKNWDKARDFATVVITESGRYEGSLPALGDVFLTGSREALWQMPPVSYWVNTFEGTAFNISGYVQYAITDGLAVSFESGDQRAVQWLDAVPGQGQTYMVPSKYKADTYSGAATEQYVMMRMAEQFLIRAEAAARSNDVEAAIGDLNVIRERAGLPDLLPGMSTAAALAAVEQENRVEFFAEWGHRWLDLNRSPALAGTGTRADEVLRVFKPGKWQPTAALYPVPQKEISLNAALAPNNAGY